MFSSRTMTDADWNQIKHFSKSEFTYPEAMGYEFMLWLDKVRVDAGVPIHITSSHRTTIHNKAVGGAQDSAHVDVPCNAFDALPSSSAERFAIVRALILNGCVRIGIYKDGSIHGDRTEDRRPSHVLWNAVTNPA